MSDDYDYDYYYNNDHSDGVDDHDDDFNSTRWKWWRHIHANYLTKKWVLMIVLRLENMV